MSSTVQLGFGAGPPGLAFDEPDGQSRADATVAGQGQARAQLSLLHCRRHLATRACSRGPSVSFHARPFFPGSGAEL